jgi:hypothetical protein
VVHIILSLLVYNSIQHNDYVVMLHAAKAFKSPLLRSKNDRCQMVRDVRTFPDKRFRGESRRGRGR